MFTELCSVPFCNNITYCQICVDCEDLIVLAYTDEGLEAIDDV